MKTPRIRLDWKSYFKAFCEAHGEPIRHGNRLLFPDGWTYHALDHKGPEWPPPENANNLRALQIKYWDLRLAMIQSQRQRIEGDLRALDEMQRARAIPLYEKKSFREETADGTTLKMESRPIDTTLLTERLVWLSVEADKCVTKLKELHDATQRQSETV